VTTAPVTSPKPELPRVPRCSAVQNERRVPRGNRELPLVSQGGEQRPESVVAPADVILGFWGALRPPLGPEEIQAFRKCGVTSPHPKRQEGDVREAASQGGSQIRHT
jgi:hypothetical protein